MMVIPCLCLSRFSSCTVHHESPDLLVWGLFSWWAVYRTRTCDLLHVKQMLYQLS